MLKNKSFYVIRNSNIDAGMGSLISSVLGHLKMSEEYSKIPVIDWEYYNCLYKEHIPILNTQNPWEYYFEPVANYRIEDLKEFYNIVYTDGSHPLNVPFPWANVKDLINMYRKYVKFNQETYRHLNSGVENLGISETTLGVHFRAAKHMRTMPNHPIQPTRRQLQKLIDNELNTGIYLNILFATDVEDELIYFQKRYGNLIVSFESERFERGQDLTPKVMGTRNLHNYLLGLEVLKETFALSRSGGLVAGYSGVSQLAEIMRLPDKKYRTKLIDNGRLSHYKLIARHQFQIKSNLPKHFGGF